MTASEVNYGGHGRILVILWRKNRLIEIEVDDDNKEERPLQDLSMHLVYLSSTGRGPCQPLTYHAVGIMPPIIFWEL